MIKHMSLALIALSVAAGQASALSCIRPDVAAAFNYVAEADDSFVVLRGSFDFPTDQLPDPAAPPVAKSIKSTFSGDLLTGDGFTDAVEAPVTLALTCAGPWCGRISPNTDYIAYVLQTDTQLILDVGPCYQFAFPNPTDETVALVEQCAAGGDCTPAK